MNTKLAENSFALALLPVEEERPVESLHLAIHAASEKLNSLVIGEHPHTRALLDVQAGLHRSLSSTLPAFMPFFEADNSAMETYESPCIQGWKGWIQDSANFVYLDEVLAAVQQYTSARTRAHDADKVRQAFIRRFASTWKDVCEAHVEAVWVEVNRAIVAALDDVCGDREMLQARFM